MRYQTALLSTFRSKTIKKSLARASSPLQTSPIPVNRGPSQKRAMCQLKLQKLSLIIEATFILELKVLVEQPSKVILLTNMSIKRQTQASEATKCGAASHQTKEEAWAPLKLPISIWIPRKWPKTQNWRIKLMGKVKLWLQNSRMILWWIGSREVST